MQSEDDLKLFFGEGKMRRRGTQMKSNLKFMANVLIPVMTKKINKQLQDYRSEDADIL